MNDMRGIVFDIQKFSVNDGPGVRTTVFLKGCQMKCLWCHNPESLSMKPQLSFSKDKCAGCRECEAVCPTGAHSFSPQGEHHVDFSVCDACGKCVDACIHGALKIYGKEQSVDEVFAEVVKDKIYFDKSGGGMTLSGGEALKQFDFSLALAKKCQENGIHVCLETNGASKPEHYRKIAPYVDLFLFDYKATGEKTHKELTGLSQNFVHQNLKLLNDIGAQIILRCPLIPGYNVSEGHLKAIAELSHTMPGIQKVEILPYHNFGKSKAHDIGRQYTVNAEMPDETRTAKWLERIQSYGVINVSLG